MASRARGSLTRERGRPHLLLPPGLGFGIGGDESEGRCRLETSHPTSSRGGSNKSVVVLWWGRWRRMGTHARGGGGGGGGQGRVSFGPLTPPRWASRGGCFREGPCRTLPRVGWRPGSAPYLRPADVHHTGTPRAPPHPSSYNSSRTKPVLRLPVTPTRTKPNPG